ncbi:MAG: transglutaminase family protein, partial [Candidatus Binatia bacterium]
MIFEIGCELEYTAKFPSTLILSIYAQRNASQTIRAEHFTVEPKVATHEFVAEGGGNRFLRLQTGKHKKLHLSYAATVEADCKERPAHTIATTPIAELDSAALPYLFPSRYCQSDRLAKLAWDLFGAIEKPYDTVIAITDWIHDNVEYVRGMTTSETSAYDTVTQRVGVCRDFAHLGIALCR